MRLYRTCYIAMTIAATAAATLAAAGGQETPAALTQKLQAHYQTVQDFSADFTHTYEGGVLKRKTTERGTVLVKKPGRMRWTYTQPEEKVFVSDGLKLYAHVPADKQVTVSSLPREDRASTPILFLAGKGDLVRDFTARTADPGRIGAGVTFPSDTIALELTPRTKVPEYEWLVLVADRASMKLRSLIARDAQGGTSTFTFANLKENVGLQDNRFAFSIPRGTDVIAHD